MSSSISRISDSWILWLEDRVETNEDILREAFGDSYDEIKDRIIRARNISEANRKIEDLEEKDEKLRGFIIDLLLPEENPSALEIDGIKITNPGDAGFFFLVYINKYPSAVFTDDDLFA